MSTIPAWGTTVQRYQKSLILRAHCMVCAAGRRGRLAPDAAGGGNSALKSHLERSQTLGAAVYCEQPGGPTWPEKQSLAEEEQSARKSRFCCFGGPRWRGKAARYGLLFLLRARRKINPAACTTASWEAARGKSITIAVRTVGMTRAGCCRARERRRGWRFRPPHTDTRRTAIPCRDASHSVSH